MAAKEKNYALHDRPLESRINALEEWINGLLSELREATSSHRAALQAVEDLREEVRALKSQSAPPQSDDGFKQARPWVESVFVPNLGITGGRPGPFMAWSTCSAADMLAAEYQQICTEIFRPLMFHRKLWEWAFIVHHLRRLHAIGPGRRGLVFGVGTEPLPSLFAKDGAHITATDAPAELGIAAGWTNNQEYAARAEDIRHPGIIDQASFMERVRYATCDMNNIAPEFNDFDFCWSSCCYEHLGSLQAGMDFVINSVEKTLKIGGIACHTTEFNLSSNDATIESGPTVVYRKRDMEALMQELRARGHEVDEFKIAPDAHPLDFYVDVPPHWKGPHLRLRLMEHTVTSAGLVIRRGR